MSIRFKIQHNNLREQYFKAKNTKDGDEIENRLSLLVHLGRIRDFSRLATSQRVKPAPKWIKTTPEKIMRQK
jgi:hypothetical protein